MRLILTLDANRNFSSRRQRGVVLIVALIVLALMTAAGLSMMRMMGSGVAIAGNLAFKQTATAAADSGTDAGNAFVKTTANLPLLVSDQPGSGYYASDAALSATPDDWSQFPWSSAAVTLPKDTLGNTVSYVIQRMCSSAGMPDTPGIECSGYPTTWGQSKTPPCGGCPLPDPLTQAYYRITTRVQGPRNTVSYTQAFVY